MKRILLTGISGVGKSTVTVGLAGLGYKAVDADDAAFSEWVAVSGSIAAAAGTPVEPDRDWVWREDRVDRLLSTEDAPVLFVSGCAANMRKFLPRFDQIVLLSVSARVIAERLRTRTNNAYGKRAEEIARVLQLKESVEPLLRKAASYELDTSPPLASVVAEIVRRAKLGSAQ